MYIWSSANITFWLVGIAGSCLGLVAMLHSILSTLGLPQCTGYEEFLCPGMCNKESGIFGLPVKYFSQSTSQNMGIPPPFFDCFMVCYKTEAMPSWDG